MESDKIVPIASDKPAMDKSPVRLTVAWRPLGVIATMFVLKSYGRLEKMRVSLGVRLDSTPGMRYSDSAIEDERSFFFDFNRQI